MNKPTFTKEPCIRHCYARLIASAPEMHALLARVASDDLGDVQTAVELAMDARELLAKVEGEK